MRSALDSAKSAFNKVSDARTGFALAKADECGLERWTGQKGFGNTPGKDAAFFDSLYWLNPANSSEKVVANFYTKVQKIAEAQEPGTARAAFANAMAAQAVDIVLAAKLVQAAKAEKALAPKRVPRATVVVKCDHNFRLASVVRTEQARGYKFVCTFTDGSTCVIKRPSPFIFAAIRPRVVNTNMCKAGKVYTGRNYVSLHRVAPQGDRHNPVVQTLVVSSGI